MSVDAIQEVAVQTSNFSAEFGQVGGGSINFTMKSGSNQFHGSSFDYFANEALNAGLPWSDGGNGQHLRPTQRRNNYGGSLGGPLSLGKFYDGHNKTFFFANFEQFYESILINSSLTVPTSQFRNGDFSSILTGKVLGTDPLQRPIMENAIYDPATQRIVNGQTVRDPFPNNVIRQDQLDPTALKIQSLIPNPGNSGVVNNLIIPFPDPRTNTIPSVKLDHAIGAKTKVSFFFSLTRTRNELQPQGSNNEGLPPVITAGRTYYLLSKTTRLNLERTISPTVLLHFGVGYIGYTFNQLEHADYDATTELGLKGIPVNRLFPTITGLSSALGGGPALGLGAQPSINTFLKPSANTSLSWVKNNHSYRFGAEFRTEGYFRQSYTNTAGAWNFAGAETSLPSAAGQNLSGGTIGFPYASFLLGLVDSLSVSQPSTPRVGKNALGIYAQDTWKVTRTLTVDYGLRYDYQTYLKEQYGRLPSFSATAPNPLFGNIPGAPVFEGDGADHCNCNFAKNYPWAFAPRLGVAYQITPKTVLRGGFGLVYGQTVDGGVSNAFGLATSNVGLGAGSAGVDVPVTTFSAGSPLNPVWPNYSPAQFPAGSSLTMIDPSSGRPPRQAMWSFGLQREITPNLAVEASYAGNHGVWWQGDSLTNINGLTVDRLNSFGLDINNAADRTLLTSAVNSASATARGFNKLPFPGFVATQTVAQALRPFPQYGAINTLWAPLGSTWFNSLQTKVTKRTSHGLNFTNVFTWSKQLTLGAENDSPAPGVTPGAAVTDPSRRNLNKELSSFDRPFVETFAVAYTTPRLPLQRLVSAIFGSWQVGTVATYSSGAPIRVPLAQNRLSTMLLGSTSNSTRVPGVPLFTQDLNCHCFDPGKTFVFNSNAWTDPPAGQFGTAASYYSDYRQQRRPVENASLTRFFQIKEGVRLQLRAEFTNVFNRTQVPVPTGTNALATPVVQPNGYTVSGFGRINTLAPGSGQRTGTLLVRIQF